ncbi:MAG: hypothetical protein EBS01_05040 [Verrucomicrobia bacterium]|nr:hypothetical protein [Verrucomicrobiota bacterium]
MAAHKPVSAKIIVGACGLGTPDMDLVGKRAREVAEIQAHPSPTAADWAEARRELHGSGVGEGLGPGPDFGGALGEGDLPDFVRDLKATRSANDDDPTVAEELIREGMEEAEHERMLLARKEEAL